MSSVEKEAWYSDNWKMWWLGKMIEYNSDDLEEVLWEMTRRWARTNKITVTRTRSPVSLKKKYVELF